MYRCIYGLFKLLGVQLGAVREHYVVVWVCKLYDQARFQMQSIVLQKKLYEQKNHHHVLEHVVVELNIGLKYDPMPVNKIFININKYYQETPKMKHTKYYKLIQYNH